jgi:hypothetical protein
VTPLAKVTVVDVTAKGKSVLKDALENPLLRRPAHDAREAALVPRVGGTGVLEAGGEG